MNWWGRQLENKAMWYLLFDGSSEDGRGEPTYVGRTKHQALAYKHFKKVSKSPYSTGKVMIANDFKLWRAEEKDFADRNTLDLQEKYDECFDNFI